MQESDKVAVVKSCLLRARARPYPCRWKKEELVDDKYTSLSIEKVVEELKQRYLIWVFPTGDFEPYMGPYIGTNHFYNAGLLKAWSREYECKKW